MRYTVLIVLALPPVLLIGGVLVRENGPAPPESPASSTEEQSQAGDDPPRARNDQGYSPAQPDARGDSQTAYGLSEKELERKRRLERRARAAEERFDNTVAMDGLGADDVDPAVRSLFQSMTLEPAFDLERGEPGQVDGMHIRHLRPNNPLAHAGFETGDRLVRINGESLRDPAQIATLFTRIEGAMEVCAERSGSDRCRTIALDAH